MDDQARLGGDLTGFQRPAVSHEALLAYAAGVLVELAPAGESVAVIKQVRVVLRDGERRRISYGSTDLTQL